jgi:DNA-binding transcriptional MerR regulator
MQEWLSVGEVASLFNLNVQTLRYYDSIGVFKPARKRGSKGDRRYQFDQIYRLAMIRFLKKLGYPLQGIKASMDARTLEYSLAQMRGQALELRERCVELERISEAIDRKVRFVEERTAKLDPASVETRSFPRRPYLPLGVEENLYRNDDFYFYPTVVFYNGDSKSFGAMLIDGGQGLDKGLEPLESAAGDYVVGYHRGPYERIGDSFSRIREEAARRRLALADETVNVNIIDQFVERDARNYVTEIQIAIRPH